MKICPEYRTRATENVRRDWFQAKEDLFGHIPEEVKVKGSLAIPKGMSELEVRRKMQKIAGKKITFSVGMFLSDKHVYDDIQIRWTFVRFLKIRKPRRVEVFGGGGEDFRKGYRFAWPGSGAGDGAGR